MDQDGYPRRRANLPENYAGSPIDWSFGMFKPGFLFIAVTFGVCAQDRCPTLEALNIADVPRFLRCGTNFSGTATFQAIGP